MSTHNMFSCRNKVSVVFGQKKKKSALSGTMMMLKFVAECANKKNHCDMPCFFFSVANLTLSHKTFRRRLLSTI